MYIVKRTQLYLEDDQWKLLHKLARQEKSTVSDLVRRAVRQTYTVDFERRRRAAQAIVGLWADRDDIGDTGKYVRRLRQGTRLARFRK
jgi:hypothetical protein